MAMTMKAARVNAGLLQREVCEKLNISKGTLVSYEKGRTAPNIETAKKIASLYGVTIEDIKFF